MKSSVRELLKRIYCIGRVWCHARNSVLEQVVCTLQEFLRLPPLTRVIVNLNKKMIFWRKNVRHSQWPPSLLKHYGGTGFQAHHSFQSSLLWTVLAVDDQFLGLWTQWNWFRAHWTYWKLLFKKDGWKVWHMLAWWTEFQWNAHSYNLQLTGMLEWSSQV